MDYEKVERLPFKLRGTALRAVGDPTPENIRSFVQNAKTCWKYPAQSPRFRAVFNIMEVTA